MGLFQRFVNLVFDIFDGGDDEPIDQSDEWIHGTAAWQRRQYEYDDDARKRWEDVDAMSSGHQV